MPGFSAYGGNGGYYGGGSGYFGGGASLAPATGYGVPSLGAGAGTQGLPYGAGFNQVSGAPLGSQNAAAYAKQQSDANAAYFKSAVDSQFSSGGKSPSAPATSFASPYAGGVGGSAQAISFSGGGAPAQGQSFGSLNVPTILPQPTYYTASQFAGSAPISEEQAHKAFLIQNGGWNGSVAAEPLWQYVEASKRYLQDIKNAYGQQQANAANAQLRSQYDQNQLSYNRLLQEYANQESGLDKLGQSQLADIARRYQGYEGKGVQNAISRGLAPQYANVGTFEAGRAGTPLASMLRGLRYDQEQANNAAMEDINTQKTSLSSNRLQAYERILAAQAQQANQFAQLQLERDRLSQQSAQFNQSLAARQFGGGGGGSSGGLPNLGQTGIQNYGQLDRFGYYPGNVGYGAPSGVLGGFYSGSPTSAGYDPYYSPGSTYGGQYEYGNVDFGGVSSPADLFTGGGYDLTGWDFMGG